MHKTVVRDAVHGNIELSPLEEKIVDSKLMQRLRFIRQLSTAYLVYPSAQHSRFEHSLGAMHLSGVLARKLEFTQEETQMLRLTALLHDVGHGAFAHDTDEIILERTGKLHEERGIDLVANGEIGREIEKASLQLDDLFEVMKGKGSGGMLSSDLGADRIDYLLRDAYFTGVSYSLIDAERLMDSVVFRKGEVMITEKGRLAAESLLISRHFMFNAVYYHPAVRISKQMLKMAVIKALEEGKIRLEDVALGTDYALLEKLSSFSPLAQRIFERRLYKKAVVVDAHSNSFYEKFFSSKKAEKEIVGELEKAGLKEGEFVVCMPESSAKKFSVKLEKPDGGVEELARTSALIRALQQPSDAGKLIVACEEKNKHKAHEALARLLKL